MPLACQLYVLWWPCHHISAPVVGGGPQVNKLEQATSDCESRVVAERGPIFYIGHKVHASCPRDVGARAKEDFIVRSNASLDMVAWGPSPVNRLTD